MQTYNTVLFDLDGTLLNTLEDLGDSVNYALNEFGYPGRTYEEVKGFIGEGVHNLIRQALPKEMASDEQIKEVLSVFRGHYKNNWQNKTRPYDEIIDAVDKLYKRGKKMGVLSNKYDAATKKLCEDFFASYIQGVLGEREDIPRKPNPAGIFELFKMLNTSPISAVYVGDSPVDVYTAHAANIPCIAVTWGFRSKSELIEAGADYVVDRPKELLMLDILK